MKNYHPPKHFRQRTWCLFVFFFYNCVNIALLSCCANVALLSCCANVALFSLFWFDFVLCLTVHVGQEIEKRNHHWDYKQSVYKYNETGFKLVTKIFFDIHVILIKYLMKKFFTSSSYVFKIHVQQNPWISMMCVST